MKNNSKVTVIKEYLENEPYAKDVVKIMKGSKVLEVKKKCTLNGQCNQGDINAIKITPIKEEEKNHKREFGCLMLYFSIPKWDELLKIIDDDDVYDGPNFGKETEPHVTLLFGFHDGVTTEELKNVLSKYQSPINVEIKGVTAFKNEIFDVLKFDIQSNELHEINKELVTFPHTNRFKDYHPHMTISYLKPGKSEKYINLFEPIFKDKDFSLESNEIVYSKTDNTKDKWSI